VEAVEMSMPNGSKTLSPDLSYRSMDVGIDYINRGMGISLSTDDDDDDDDDRLFFIPFLQNDACE
jgi:hypothetical protein